MGPRRILRAVALPLLLAQADRPETSKVTPGEIRRTMMKLSQAVLRLEAHIKNGGNLSTSLIENSRKERVISSHSGKTTDEESKEANAALQEHAVQGDLLGAQEEKKSPYANGGKYQHYPGTPDEDEEGQMKYVSDHHLDVINKNENLEVYLSKLTDFSAESNEFADVMNRKCVVDESKSATIEGLEQCMNAVMEYFKVPVTKAWKKSQAQNDNQAKLFEAMFDHIRGLADVVPGLLAYKTDVKKVGGALLDKAKAMQKTIDEAFSPKEKDVQENNAKKDTIAIVNPSAREHNY